MTYRRAIRVVTKVRKPRLKRQLVNALLNDEWQTNQDLADASNNRPGRVRIWLKWLIQAELVEVQHNQPNHYESYDYSKQYRLIPGISSTECLKVLL